jgi:hypothetical protein
MDENQKIDPGEAMSKRVEDARKKVLAERESLKGKATKITAEILLGVDYKEEIVIKLIDGTYGLLEIHPLGEGQIIDTFAQMGGEKMKRFTNITAETTLSPEDYDFFWTIVSISSRIDKELLKKTLVLGESSYAAMKVLEISGFGANTDKELDSFPT